MTEQLADTRYDAGATEACKQIKEMVVEAADAQANPHRYEQTYHRLAIGGVSMSAEQLADAPGRLAWLKAKIEEMRAASEETDPGPRNQGFKAGIDYFAERGLDGVDEMSQEEMVQEVLSGTTTTAR